MVVQMFIQNLFGQVSKFDLFMTKVSVINSLMFLYISYETISCL